MLLSRNSECKGNEKILSFVVMSYELFVGTRGFFFKCSHNVTHNSSLVTHPSPEYFLGYLSRMASMAHVHAEGVIQVSDDADG